MAENSFTQFPIKISVKKSCPPRRPIRMSTEEDLLKFELTTLALRKTFQHTYPSTDSSKPTILLCPSCNFQSSESLEDHQEHHEQNYGLQCPLCSYSVSEEDDLNFHLIHHHSRINFVHDDKADGEVSRGVASPSKNQDSPVKKRKGSSNKPILRCDECLYETLSELVLMKHRFSHVMKSKYECDRCSYSVSDPKRLSLHTRLHHSAPDQDLRDASSGLDDAPHSKRVKIQEECGECNFSTCDTTKMKIHRRNHSSSYTMFTLEPYSGINPILDLFLHGHKWRFYSRISFSYPIKNILLHHVKNHHGNDAIRSLAKPDQIANGNEPKCPSSGPEEAALMTTNNCKLDSPFIEPRMFGEEERTWRGEEKIAILPRNLDEEMSYREEHHAAFPTPEQLKKATRSNTPRNDLEFDSLHNEPGTDAEEKSWREEEQNHTSASISPEDLVSDPPPIKSGNLDEEKSCHEHENKATSPSPEPEKVSNYISPSTDLVPDQTPIEPRNLDEEERSCREQLKQLEEALQTDGRSLENSSNQLMELEEKMQSLRKRVETAKKNEQITEKMLKDLLLNKEEVEEQKKETKIKKMKLEFELRTEQCKALELDLIEPDAVEEDHQERVALVQKKVQSLEEELGEIEKELISLDEQEEAITEDLVDAEECYVKAFRSLCAMITELEGLESVWMANVKFLNQLVDTSKGRIRVYHQLEEELLEIELEKIKNNLIKKRSSQLRYLKTQFDDLNVVY